MVWWWFGANMAGQRNKYAFKFLLHLLTLSQKHILSVKKVVWDGLDLVWWWFGANMAGQRNKNAFKFLPQLMILSQKHILGVKKVVWDGLDVVWVVSYDPELTMGAKRPRWKLLGGEMVWAVTLFIDKNRQELSRADKRHFMHFSIKILLIRPYVCVIYPN